MKFMALEYPKYPNGVHVILPEDGENARAAATLAGDTNSPLNPSGLAE